MWGNFRARINRGWEAIKSGQRKWMWVAGKKIISKNEREAIRWNREGNQFEYHSFQCLSYRDTNVFLWQLNNINIE